MGFAGETVDIPKRIFVLFVTLATIVPRMPFDLPLFSWPLRRGWWRGDHSDMIGGDLSRPFRKLLLAICFLHFLRQVLDFSNKGWKLFLNSSEGIALSFLSLLTPYLLRVWLSERINLPGGRRPGSSLMPWLYAVIGLSLIGVLLRTWTGRGEMWVAKKIADGLIFIPVVRTLGWYNTVTTGQARYAGRGLVLSQLVFLAECYNLLAVLIDIVIQAMHVMGFVDLYSKGALDPTLRIIFKGMYADNHFANYTRVFCHSVLINCLDETYQLHASTNDENSTTRESSTTTPREHWNSEANNDNDNTTGSITHRGSSSGGPGSFAVDEADDEHHRHSEIVALPKASSKY